MIKETFYCDMSAPVIVKVNKTFWISEKLVKVKIMILFQLIVLVINGVTKC